MMCCLCGITLLAFATNVRYGTSEIQDSMVVDNLVGPAPTSMDRLNHKLFERTQTRAREHCAHLDKSMLGKPGRLAILHRPSLPLRAIRHVRSSPRDWEESDLSISELHAFLQKAVDVEDYGEAARINEKIKALRSNAVLCVQEANDKLYEAFRTNDKEKFREVWGEGPHVRCTHPGVDRMSSSGDVMELWEFLFRSLPEGGAVQIIPEDIQVHVGRDWGVVTCVERVLADSGEALLAATNVFEEQDGKWVITHRQASTIQQQNASVVLRTLFQSVQVSKNLPAGRDVKAGFWGQYEKPAHYAFRVGDIVIHRVNGQIGVVAQRFDVGPVAQVILGTESFQTEALPGTNPKQPFYNILVQRPGRAGLTRHGAQSTHRKWDHDVDGVPQPVDHADVPALFSELDTATARYKPLDATAAAQKATTPEWDQDQR